MPNKIYIKIIIYPHIFGHCPISSGEAQVKIPSLHSVASNNTLQSGLSHKIPEKPGKQLHLQLLGSNVCP
jgi:hypothetical protein